MAKITLSLDEMTDDEFITMVNSIYSNLNGNPSYTTIAPTAAVFHERIPFTPRTKKVLERAKMEAESFRHTYIDTEHILLALLTEKEGLAAEVFRKLNFNADEANQEIQKELVPKQIKNDRISSVTASDATDTKMI